jgi:hypothetical protein
LEALLPVVPHCKVEVPVFEALFEVPVVSTVPVLLTESVGDGSPLIF